jgi:hypothetical protein
LLFGGFHKEAIKTGGGIARDRRLKEETQYAAASDNRLWQ